MSSQQVMLIAAVAGVGVLHTIVPDHWAPITILARQQGWARSQTVRAAALAGSGHTASTLLIAVVLWTAGVVFAARFGHAISLLSSISLVGFGLWIALGSLREMRGHGGHGHSHMSHAHAHAHVDGTEHRHVHDHHDEDWHSVDGNLALAPVHEHEHRTSSRTALLLILGSSPMVEGIPAFFAASRYGVAQLIVMAIVFAVSTISTYIILCATSTAGLQRLNLGSMERYGEVLSGLFMAALGAVFLVFPTF